MVVNAILFDKDGTLFDFHATWSVWTGRAIEHLSKGDSAVAARLAEVTHFDVATRKLRPTSPVIAFTSAHVDEIFLSALPDHLTNGALAFLAQSAADVDIVPAVPLRECLAGLAARGLALGVMTNDTEFGARTHLGKAGVADMFRFIAGFDSGYGAKPDPAPLLAFAKTVDVAPETVVMVGDSIHDLEAGRAAGMQTIGVLTGVAIQADLAPYADVVLADVGHIAAWLT